MHDKMREKWHPSHRKRFFWAGYRRHAEKLRNEDPMKPAKQEDERFARVFSSFVEYLDLPDGTVADYLKVSRASVRRWKKGQNLPYMRMRGEILRALAEL